MGWNEVYQTGPHPLWDGIAQGSRFYFVHSYFPVPAEAALAAGYSRYPFEFTCAVAAANLFAVQFHPEKSHTAGLQLLTNFVRWTPQTTMQATGMTLTGAS
jgi:glutamine amidotransferase